MADDDIAEELEEVELEEELEEEFVEELDEEDLPDALDDEPVADDADVVAPEEEEEEAPAVPARRKAAVEEEDEEEELDPDDVEADLDTILKDRIASGDDLDEEEEEEVPDRNDPDATEGVAAKKEGEFTCDLCFLIVHPRQFGRKDRLTCPEGYDQCPSITRVSKALK